MSWFFPKKTTKSLHDENQKTIQLLEESITMIDKKIAHNEILIQKLTTTINEMIKQKKEKSAIMPILKRKQRINKNIKDLEGQKENLELQCNSIRTIIFNKQLVSSMKMGADLLKKHTKDININDVDEFMTTYTETTDDINQISQVLSQPIIISDDTELENELDDMILMNDVTDVPTMPIVPSGGICMPTTNKDNEDDDDKELEKLRSEVLK
jgi:hypothetical protein